MRECVYVEIHCLHGLHDLPFFLNMHTKVSVPVKVVNSAKWGISAEQKNTNGKRIFYAEEDDFCVKRKASCVMGENSCPTSASVVDMVCDFHHICATPKATPKVLGHCAPPARVQEQQMTMEHFYECMRGYFEEEVATMLDSLNDKIDSMESWITGKVVNEVSRKLCQELKNIITEKLNGICVEID